MMTHHSASLSNGEAPS